MAVCAQVRCDLLREVEYRVSLAVVAPLIIALTEGVDAVGSSAGAESPGDE